MSEAIALSIPLPRFTLPRPPHWRDARYLQLTILSLYCYLAHAFFHLERPHSTVVICVAVSCTFDYLLGAFLYRKPVFPLSAAIVALSTCILLDSHVGMGYTLIVIAAILSKALFTYKGRHYFNPTAIAATAGLLLLPESLVGFPALFTGYVWPSVLFASLGLLTVIYARQTVVSLSWYFGFLVFAVMRALIAHASIRFLIGPAFGPGVLLFTFHMISDPGTTPKTTRWGIIFGVGAAAIDSVLRAWHVPFGNFYALAIAGSLLPWIRDREEPLLRAAAQAARGP